MGIAFWGRVGNDARPVINLWEVRALGELKEPLGCRVHCCTGKAAGAITGLLVRRSGPDGKVALWLELAGVDLGRFIGRTSRGS